MQIERIDSGDQAFFNKKIVAIVTVKELLKMCKKSRNKYE